MNRQEAKQQIERLVKKFSDLTPVEFKKKNESMTCKDFILPLFQALGWDVYNNISNHEVTSETQVSGGRADYAFHINDVIKFFVEAKKPSVDLREAKHAEQAISYAWHKSVPWAILTDFEDIKVYNAEWDEPDAERSLIFEINYKDFLKDEKLWWLSKESMLKGELDKYAEANFKKPKKEAVDKLLANDLVKWRMLLFNDLKGWNSDKNLSDKQIAESVQRLLDRLIFIRTTEDRKIEGEKLREIVRNWEDGKGKLNLADEMKKLFKDYNDGYNSKLFEPAICDALEYEDELLARIIKELYKNAKGIRYDFASINADILGSIYEQYLGQIQQEEKDKKSGKRKSQGIYYTPRYIVDYIVKNTLGELLKGKSGFEASKIKILDPACGSGSFLIKAFEVLDNHIKRENNQQEADVMKNYLRKVNILTSNIYGVDLDQEAVEIAQLNLLLKVLGRRELLPNLAHNIENGNSLISGKGDELKKYFGENWKDKKPFNWQEKFESVFKQEGFDVIIGNPPYIRNRELNTKDKDFFGEYFKTSSGQYDIYQLFFELSINLLKDGGYLGFITSNKYAIADYGKKLREFILENCKIVKILDVSNLQVFKDASTYPYAIILQKTKNNKNHIMKGYKVLDELKLNNNEIKINQEDIKNSSTKNFTVKKEIDFLTKMESASEKLGDIATIKETIHTGNVRNKLITDKKDNDNCKKLLAGRDCHRYNFKWGGKYIRYDKNLIEKDKGEYGNLCDKKYFELPKILLRDISLRPEAVLDNDKYYSVNTLYSVQAVSKKYHLLYLLAVINSSLINFYFKQKFEDAHVSGGFLRFKKIYTSQIPIYKIDFKDKKEKAKHDELVRLSDKMLEKNKELQKLDPIMDDKEYNEVKKEIEKTDKEIDKKVYEIYGLGEGEIEIVEK
ncbi:MAG: TaqI-like C-terminal specificity domain-containing protein [Patescibacteria group bacterium]|nr:TaqI-like C-terminal specificity domain-containing protein [Patescibacteria group bacterium]